MFYNVDNLFDSEHEPGKYDYAYLPLGKKINNPRVKKYCESIDERFKKWRNECFNMDWSHDVYVAKRQNISRVVRSYENGRGPDIAVFAEIENFKVLQAIADNDLGDLGYHVCELIEGPDKRGIDVGLISKFKLAGESRLHPLNLEILSGERLKKVYRGSRGRGILEVSLMVHDKIITVFANHWPSPLASKVTRLIAGRSLRKRLEGLSSGGSENGLADRLAIAVGDFNILEREFPDAIKTHLTVSGTLGYFFDVYKKCLEVSGSFCTWPRGTYYSGRWKHFDRIFFSDSFLKDKEIVFHWSDFRIYAPGKILTRKGRPKRFNPKTGHGYSDHLPVVMEFGIVGSE